MKLTTKSIKEQIEAQRLEEESKINLEGYFPNILFNEELHKYTFNGKKLTSVTTHINKFVEPFKSHQIASQVAKSKAKKGLPSDKSYYLKYWHLKGAVARERGNLLHWYASTLPALDTPQNALELNLSDFYHSYIVGLQNEEVVATELITYFKGLAGTIDLVTIKEDGTLHLYDWKTNDDFDKSYNKMKAPFDDYKDSARSKYTLQLALYKWIIESATPFKVSEMTIVSIKEEGWQLINMDEDLLATLDNVLNANENEDN